MQPIPVPTQVATIVPLAQTPTPIPGPIPVPLPADWGSLGLLLYNVGGGGVIFGILASWLIDFLIREIDSFRGVGHELDTNGQRIVSLGVPAALVLVGYVVLLLTGSLLFTPETVYGTLANIAISWGIGKGTFAVRRHFEAV